ncbi:hypothetical protein RyT2_24610 [Pseudolactococcus yaeyamensis]
MEINYICSFRFFTGIPCPCCGMTRAFLNILSGNMVEAFAFHALFWLVPIFFVILLFYLVKKKRIYLTLLLGMAGINFLYYLFRLVTGFPQGF